MCTKRSWSLSNSSLSVSFSFSESVSSSLLSTTSSTEQTHTNKQIHLPVFAEVDVSCGIHTHVLVEHVFSYCYLTLGRMVVQVCHRPNSRNVGQLIVEGRFDGGKGQTVLRETLPHDENGSVDEGIQSPNRETLLHVKHTVDKSGEKEGERDRKRTV